MATVLFCPTEFLHCSWDMGMGWASVKGRSHPQARGQGLKGRGFRKGNTTDKPQKAVQNLQPETQGKERKPGNDCQALTPAEETPPPKSCPRERPEKALVSAVSQAVPRTEVPL